MHKNNYFKMSGFSRKMILLNMIGFEGTFFLKNKQSTQSMGNCREEKRNITRRIFFGVFMFLL
jgi:hypothetical protein